MSWSCAASGSRRIFFPTFVGWGPEPGPENDDGLLCYARRSAAFAGGAVTVLRNHPVVRFGQSLTVLLTISVMTNRKSLRCCRGISYPVEQSAGGPLRASSASGCVIEY